MAIRRPVDPPIRLTRSEGVYQAEISRFAVEHRFYFGRAHCVEVIGNFDLAGEETKTAHWFRYIGLNGDNLDHRFPRLRYHERLAVRGLFDQTRQVGLGFMDVDGLHFHGPEWN